MNTRFHSKAGRGFARSLRAVALSTTVLAFGSAGATITTHSCASASFCTLDELVNGGAFFEVDELTFDGFSYDPGLALDFFDFSPLDLDISDLILRPLGGPGGLLGFNFTQAPGTATPISDFVQPFLVLAYNVSAAPTSRGVVLAGAEFGSDVPEIGVFDPSFPSFADMRVFDPISFTYDDTTFATPGFKVSDLHLDVLPHQHFNAVDSGIFLDLGAPLNITYLFQVPEPTSLALALLALLGLSGRVRPAARPQSCTGPAAGLRMA